MEQPALLDLQIASNRPPTGVTRPHSSSVIINVEEPAGVDEWAERARRAGATITKKPVDAEFFSGRDAYFADPEGNFWEVAWAPADNPVTAVVRRAAGLST